MRKLIILIALFLTPLITLSQSINENKNGFTEVIEVELTQEEIYGKIKEWITLSYKSANEVIQLDSDDKIILKGNLKINYIGSLSEIPFRLDHTIIFSLRNSKYKIDFNPTGATNLDNPNGVVQDYIILDLINSFTKEEYVDLSMERAEKLLISAGFKNKRLEKGLKVTRDGLIKKGYDNYLQNKETLKSEVGATFKSIIETVKKSSDDDW